MRNKKLLTFAVLGAVLGSVLTFSWTAGFSILDKLSTAVLKSPFFAEDTTSVANFKTIALSCGGC